jgi:glycosyl transferase family 87
MSIGKVSILLVLLLMLVCSLYYLPGILVPAQGGTMKAKAGGYFSDLYPPWYGSREFILHGRNPYSNAVSQEIQRGVYGGALVNHSPGVDEQRFAYPLYTAFLLIPLIAVPFAVLKPVAAIGLALLTAASLVLWSRAMGVTLRSGASLFWAGLLLVWLPVTQGIWLQQLGLLVCFLLAASLYCLAVNRPVVSGVLLALAMIKPQVALPFIFFLAFWVAGDMRARFKVAIAASATMVGLLISSFLLLPGWLGDWITVLRQYRTYTQSWSLIEILAGQGGTSVAITAAVWALTAWFCWRLRKSEVRSAGFNAALCLAVASGVITSPNWQFHNQVVLLPLGIWFCVSAAAIAPGPQRVLPLLCRANLLIYALAVSLIVSGHLTGFRTQSHMVLGIPLLSIFFAPPLFFAAGVYSSFRSLRGQKAEKRETVALPENAAVGGISTIPHSAANRLQ